MTNERIEKVTAQPTQQVPKKSVKKAEKKMYIQEGTTVKTVKQHGSSGQKLAAGLFDVDKNGVYNYDEAGTMNDCVFTKESKSLTIYDKYKGKTEIKFGDNPELFDDKNSSDESGNIKLYDKNTKMKVEISQDFEGDKSKKEIDFQTKKVKVENLSGGDVAVENANLEVKNSEVGSISTKNSSVNLKNVKDKGIIFDSATVVNTDTNSDIITDKQSKVDIKRK